MSAHMVVDPAPNPVMPTVEQLRSELDALLALILNNFQRMGINGYTANAVGVILSKIEFDKKLDKAEFTAMVDEQAKALLDKIKIALLRQSLTASN